MVTTLPPPSSLPSPSPAVNPLSAAELRARREGTSESLRSTDTIDNAEQHVELTDSDSTLTPLPDSPHQAECGAADMANKPSQQVPTCTAEEAVPDDRALTSLSHRHHQHRARIF